MYSLQRNACSLMNFSMSMHAYDPRLQRKNVVNQLGILDAIGLILSPNGVIANDDKCCTYCCYVKCVT